MTDPVPDSYTSWIDRVSGDRDAKPLLAGETVTTPGAEPFGTIAFSSTGRPSYVGEVGKKGSDYIYHFYAPAQGTLAENFEDALGDAFLEVFKFSDRIEAAYETELASWAVRARGFAANSMADELAISVFDALDRALE